jgi:two-component system, chemotaxis family, protein-glutamate methylesterase/glutaminase
MRRILMDLPAHVAAPHPAGAAHRARLHDRFADWLSASCALPRQDRLPTGSFCGRAWCMSRRTTCISGSPRTRVRLSHDPPVGGFRPSATHLFASVGKAFRSRMIGVVLTGMGADGADGLASARAVGAYVIAQDEASSIVYGMAGEAVRRGAVDAVLPVDHIAVRLIELANPPTMAAERILVVDDSPTQLEAARGLLEQSGFT